LGHGKTPLKKSKVSFEDFSKQLLKLIDKLNFKRIHLVGFSLGALIARHFASEHSDKLSSLILLGSIYKRTEEQKIVVKNRFEVAKLRRPASKRAALRRWLSEEFSKKNPAIYKKIYSILDKNNRKDFLKCYEIFVNYVDDDNLIKKINVNSLIVTGENDIGSTPEMSRNLSKMIQGSKFIEIKNGKHLCSIECADDVNIAFKKFIDQQND
jgi:pimeloyl-ACP methyl ester carboxylesterase